MSTVTVRDLRNHGGEVLDAVLRGESVTVTRQGKPVAELRPLASEGTPASIIVERWSRLPVLDLAALRADLETVLDGSL